MAAAFLLFSAIDVDSLVARARAVTLDWLERLPDFVCDQQNRRMASLDNGHSWRETGTYDVEVTYLQGRERYRLLRKNGAPVLGEQTANVRTLGSAGEFATSLKALFDEKTAAEFRDAGKELGLRRLSYRVLSENSRWSVGTEARLNPAYQGTIWVDEQSGRVHKITMLSREFPKTFSVQSAAHATDFRSVDIAGQAYLLPARSIVEACGAKGRCQRSAIEFTNYRKFTAESKIVP